MKRKRLINLGGIISIFFGLAICAFAQAGGPAGSVSITKNGFDPSNITVYQGTTVTWANGDGTIYETFSHRVVGQDGSFSSMDLGYGDTYSYTFNDPGTFVYQSGGDSSVTGSITVITGTGPVADNSIPSTISYPSSMGSSVYTVIINNYSFNPSDQTIPVGASVVWINSGGSVWDQVSYRVESDQGLFASDHMNLGDTFGYTFKDPGVYTYHNSISQYMSGMIRVTAALMATTTTTTTTQAATTTTTAPAANPSGTDMVIISDQGFSPADISAPVGTTITWISNDPNSHRVVTSGDLQAGSQLWEPQIDISNEMEFASGRLGIGGVFSHKFVVAGNYYYYDYYNPSMKGTIEIY